MRLDNAMRWLDMLMRVMAGSAIAATAIITCLAVFFRDVVGASLPWPEEVTGNLLVWTSFLGAYIAVRDNSHIGFDLLLRKLPDGYQKIALTLVDTAVACFLAVLVNTSIRMVSVVGGTSLQTVSIPVGAFMAAIPVCGTMMIIALLVRACGRWTRGAK